MIYDLPEEVLEGLKQARKRDLFRRNRLRVHIGDAVYPVARLWENGFSLEAEAAPHLRGLVDIYDGGRHLYQCLIVCSEIEGNERVFEFKRHTAVSEEAPVDFWRDANAPIALLT